jgi:hypothetical protein
MNSTTLAAELSACAFSVRSAAAIASSARSSMLRAESSAIFMKSSGAPPIPSTFR